MKEQQLHRFIFCSKLSQTSIYWFWHATLKRRELLIR